MDRWKDLALKLMEEERRRLARDIHDGPAQVLSLLTMRFEVIKRMIEQNPSMAIQEIERVQETVRSSINDLRRMIYDLKPLAFEEQGWSGVVMNHVERLKEFYGMVFIPEMDDVLPRFPEQVEMGIYRLIQECFNNIIKHAEATKVWLRMHTADDGSLHIEVEDNGKGFDTRETKSGSFGLQGMQERAALLGVFLDIDSTVGRGTKVTVVVPKGTEWSPPQ